MMECVVLMLCDEEFMIVIDVCDFGDVLYWLLSVCYGEMMFLMIVVGMDILGMSFVERGSILRKGFLDYDDDDDDDMNK